MPRVTRKVLLAQELDELPTRPLQMTLRHGQVMWLLTELGYGLGTNKSALHEYLKGLRKFGIPFGRVKFQRGDGRRRLAKYSYCHIMELAIVMSLRVYHVIPDSVLKQIIHYRRHLRRMYIKAYTFRRSGAGAPIILRLSGTPIELRGMFLNLDIRFSAGRLSHFRPPQLLTSFEALEIISKASLPGRAFLPTNLSILAERVTALALAAPILQTGPTATRKRV